MSLLSLIRGNGSPAVATAIPAIPAIPGAETQGIVARIATVAVAKRPTSNVVTPSIDVLALLAEACRGVAGLSADQYFALLSADDIAGIRGGETGVDALKAYAPQFAEGLRSGRLVVPEPPGPAHVRCGQCTHFVPDPINPPAGIGTCAVAGEGAAGFVLYPHKPRVCSNFAAAETPGPQP